MFDENTSVLPNDIERQAALDKALSSFGTPTVIQGQKSERVKGVPVLPGQGYTDNPRVVDEDEVVGDDEVDTRIPSADQDTDEIEEGDVSDEPTEENFGEGFVTEFKKAFGIEPAEAVETFNQLLNFRNEVVLMQEWNVTPGEYLARMEEVKGFYEGLPEEGKAQFNTPEGAMAIWNHLHPDGQPKQRSTQIKGARKTAKVNTAPKHMFTKSQILRMSQEEFTANAAAIQRAYAENRVNENA